MDEKLQMKEQLVVFRGVIAGRDKFFTIPASLHQSMAIGDAVLERKLIPYRTVEELSFELVKYPFCKPRILEITGNHQRMFSKLKETYIVLTGEFGFFQSHDASDLVNIHADEVLQSAAQAVDVASEDLLSFYNERLVKN